MVDRFFIDPVMAPDINLFRKELDLAPVNRFMNRWLFSSERNLALFPRDFADPQTDWPNNLLQVGPIEWTPPHAPADQEKMHDFIQNDRPLLVLGGSIGLNTNDFYSKCIKAAKATGKKLVLLASNPNAVPRQIPDHVFYSKYYPIANLLDRCSILIHSGGIGATLQSLNAGVPQVVLPQVNDQHDNADRVKRLRAGHQISPTRISAQRLADLIQRTLADRQLAERCAQLAGIYNSADSIKVACDVIEEQFHMRYTSH